MFIILVSYCLLYTYATNIGENQKNNDGAAVWDCFSSIPAAKDPVYATGISFLILYGILVMIFLVFFGLPGVYLLRATGDKRGLLIYIAGVAIFLWDKVPPVN